MFLFLLVLASGGFSIFYLSKLKRQSENVIKANYESIEYVQQMQKCFDSIQDKRSAFIDSFNVVLNRQEKNITEQGEKMRQWHCAQLSKISSRATRPHPIKNK